jgi:multiple sugar transport system ATP-binding protein
MRTEIKELHQRLKTTTVYVTHDQIEAMTMADKIVVMHDGIVEQVGAPLELYDRPANRFVAGFIGSPAMNFIDGRLEDKGFALPSGTAISLDLRPLVPVGRKMTYGIRPEQLQIVPTGTPNSIPAAVLVIEPTGSDTTLIVKAEGGNLTVVLRERCFLKPGEAIALKPAAHQAHLFDESGKRIATV